jgi:hypothetical protein
MQIMIGLLSLIWDRVLDLRKFIRILHCLCLIVVIIRNSKSNLSFFVNLH